MRLSKKLTILFATLAVSACSINGSDVDLNSFPKNQSQARAMMKKVATDAMCGSFEDFSFTDHSWKYTCQRGSQDFELVTASSKEVLDGESSVISREGYIHESKPTYIIVIPKTTNGSPSPDWLDPFRS